MCEVKKKLKIILILAPVLALLGSLFLGRYPIDPTTVFNILLSKVLPIQSNWSPLLELTVFNIRLPRIIAALLVGSCLGISGASFQGLFRNPLVDSSILGVASGAGFGAALGFLFSGNLLIIECLAFIFGILAMALAYFISKIYKTTMTLTLALAGIAVGALFTSLLSLLKFVADPYDTLPAIIFWLMGSLARVTTKDLLLFIPVMVIGIAILLAVRWKLNVLSMGDEEAMSLGVNPSRLKAVIVICGTFITAAAVCISGIITWVGLIIPHIGRQLVGSDHSDLLPACVSIGAVYILIVDDVARTVMAAELPLGILTGIIGVPIFLLLLKKKGASWQ